jgi:hypothetical protein
MTEAPLGPDVHAPYTQLCAGCADLLDKPAPPDRPFWRALSYNHPTAHHWTPAEPGSYRSACGIRSHKNPFGLADLRHCDRCAAAVEKDEGTMPVQSLAERPAMQEHLPEELAAWRWLQDVATSQWRLAASDGWMTKGYADAGRALAEAKRRVLSTPKSKPPTAPALPDLPADLASAVPAPAESAPPPAAPSLDHIPIERIRQDGGTQARAGLDEATIADYAATWQDLSYEQNGLDRMPPIVVFYDGESYWLADGFHRVAAYERFLADGKPSASPHTMRADVRQGTRREAVLYAAGANADHGLRRTTADKERAVLALLRDEEWGQWSDREIARRCKVSHDFVRNVTERHGLSTGRASSARKTADGRTMDTSGIAAANAARAESCARCGQPALGGGALTADGKKFCPNCAHAYLQEVADAQAAQTAATRQACLVAPTSPLPPDFEQARERAARIGLILDRVDGEYCLRNLRGSGVEHYDWPSILSHLANQERAAAEHAADHRSGAVCTRCGQQRDQVTSYAAGLVPEYGDRAVVLCSRCIPELLAERKASAPAATCETCGKPATTRRQIGGMLARWCDGCATKAELRAVCERAEALGATIDYTRQRSDGKLPIVPPAGYNAAELWCNAAELSRLCEAWEASARTDFVGVCETEALLQDDDDDTPFGLWSELGELLADEPAALLTAARAALDSLADSDALSTTAYEDLSRRIGQAERAMEEVEVAT